MGWLRDIVPPEARPDKDIVASARGTGLAIILCFPALYILMQEEKWPLGMSATARRVILALVIGMLLIAALRLTVAANVLALLVGVIAAAIALLQPRLVWHLCMAALALAFVVAPFAGMLLPGVEEVTQLESGPTSWVQRLAIWRNVSDLIFSSPLIFLFGGGIQFGWAVSEAGNMIEISNFDYALKIMPTHPHNYFLQIWLEFGLVGVLLHLGALWQLWAMMQKKTLTNRQMSMICGVIGAVLVFASVETSLWTLWRLAAPVLAVYVIILAVRSQKIK
jgi:O-antigen ligase